MIDDDGIVKTNDEATISKYSAASLGYFKDPFIQCFVTSKSRLESTRKLPEINRGYFVRTASITYLAENFLEHYGMNGPCQIISLGAGFDTMYWRLKSNEKFSTYNMNYVEFDMSMVTSRKVMNSKRFPQLSMHLKDVSISHDELHSDDYHIISGDMRNLTPNLERKFFVDCRLKSEVPTLCIFECVLVYMSTDESQNIINWLSQKFNKNLTIVNYEQCNMRDKFSEIMLDNMSKRHCELLGVDSCYSLETQKDRFIKNNLIYTQAWTMSEIYKYRFSSYDIDRIEKIELLDEKELLDQLLNHYCIVIGSTHEQNLIPEHSIWCAQTLV